MEYASNGKANAALTTGIIGTAGFGLSALGNLLGGWNAAQTADSGAQPVSKESFELSMKLSESERNNAILTAELNTEKKMVEVYNALNDKINRIKSEQDAVNSTQAVTNSLTTTQLAVAQNNIAQLLSLTKMVIPNGSVCPGWGTATVSVSTGTATT